MHAEPHPAELAGGVPGGDDRALRERERRDADRRRHRLVQVDEVEPLLGAAPSRMRLIERGESTMFGSDPFAGTTTERPTGITSGGRWPCRPVRGWSSRVSRPGRVVAHHELHLVAARPERVGLVLGVLDDAAPVRPRERDDDSDLHA